MSLSILISSHDRCRAAAFFTAELLDAFWKDHPPIHYCGLSAGPEGASLPLRDDPMDWMSITASACRDLLVLGYDKVYLILDDQPPMHRCHEVHLNRTLPRLLERLDAINISLLGWGQGRDPHGPVLGAEFHRIERCAPDYLWKFSLHPGLWSLRKLLSLLELLIREAPPAGRSCWEFERRSGAADFPFEKSASYRIDGLRLCRLPLRVLAFIHQAERCAADIARAAAGRFVGPAARENIEHRAISAYDSYEGPYPLFWSGFMKKGAPNPQLLFYLKLHRKTRLLRALEQFQKGSPPLPAS